MKSLALRSPLQAARAVPSAAPDTAAVVMIAAAAAPLRAQFRGPQSIEPIAGPVGSVNPARATKGPLIRHEWVAPGTLPTVKLSIIFATARSPAESLRPNARGGKTACVQAGRSPHENEVSRSARSLEQWIGRGPPGRAELEAQRDAHRKRHNIRRSPGQRGSRLLRRIETRHRPGFPEYGNHRFGEIVFRLIDEGTRAGCRAQISGTKVIEIQMRPQRRAGQQRRKAG